MGTFWPESRKEDDDTQAIDLVDYVRSYSRKHFPSLVHIKLPLEKKLLT